VRPWLKIFIIKQFNPLRIIAPIAYYHAERLIPVGAGHFQRPEHYTISLAQHFKLRTDVVLFQYKLGQTDSFRVSDVNQGYFYGFHVGLGLEGNYKVITNELNSQQLPGENDQYH
jgi:hypothetical protein